jgi:hypothetical protein
MFGLNPYSLAAKAAVILGALLVGFTSGWKVESWRWGASEAAALRAAETERDALQAKYTEASQAYEKAKQEKSVEYRTITKTVDRIVEKPVYRDRACFDDDGVQLVNRALGFPPPANSGEPDQPVPPRRAP